MRSSFELDAHSKVMVVEDHALVCDGIENLLTTHLNMTVVDRVSNGLDVYAACQRNVPDLILMDLGLPGMNGIDIIGRLKKRWSHLCIVVLTAYAMECKAREAIAMGAQAYVLKQSSRHVLFTALKTAMLGKCFVDPALHIGDGGMLESGVNKNIFSKGELTKREKQTLKLISEGHRNSDIAEKLSISLKTVETHRLNLMKKLDVHNVAELIMRSRRLGLVLL